MAENIKQKMNVVYTGGECGMAEIVFSYFNETGNPDSNNWGDVSLKFLMTYLIEENSLN